MEKESQNSSETKLPGCTLNTKLYVTEFCENTSIHGLKFLGEPRTWIERLWWAIVILSSLCLCVSLIVNTYQKWVSSPVIVSFATSQTSIKDIPFPAITVCSDIKADSKIFNYGNIEERIKNGENVSEDVFQKYNYMNMICEKSAWMNEEKSKIVDETALDFITNVAPPLSQTITKVKWRGNEYSDSSQFFTPILTTEGVCYTFNLLDKTDLFRNTAVHYKNYFSNGNRSSWSIQNGFVENVQNRYPRFSVVSGLDGGIDLVLQIFDDDIDYDCSPEFVGFKVTLQHPGLIPRGGKSFFTVPLDQIVLASVKPVMLKTSKELVSYSPDKRQCLFVGDKYLRFYTNYTQPNCLMECLTNFTLEKCKCVGFHMPRDNSTPICGPGSRICLEKAKALYLIPKPAGNNVEEEKQSFQEKCYCLPSCSALDFEVETSQSDWNWEKFHKNGFNETVKVHRSRLRIFFKDMQFITSVRNELYGTTDFLASCGGLLGLFIGFSVISLFEIIYFISLRFCCNLRKYGFKYWSGNETLFDGKSN